MGRWLLWILLLAGPGCGQRLCQTPDCLAVDSRSVRSLSLYVYVPETTATFTVGVYDQTEEGEVAQASSFVLRAPDGKETRLDAPQASAWASYPVQTGGVWGVWQLAVTGPKAADAAQSVRNAFMVRTEGEVDLYVVPAAAPRQLPFFEPTFGGENLHRLTLVVPPLQRLRVNVARGAGEHTHLELSGPQGVPEPRIAGLPRGGNEALIYEGEGLSGLWRLTVGEVKGSWRLGIEQPVRVVFHDAPLLPVPRPLDVTTAGDDGGPLPARLAIASPQTAREPYLEFTGPDGRGTAYLLPGPTYTITASHGFEYGSASATVAPADPAVSLTVPTRLQRPSGWYCGDAHVHTLYSDGSDTPAQMVESGRGDGLDWMFLTDHGAGLDVPGVAMAHQEAVPLGEPGKFLVIPGEEFTVRDYHANILGGILRQPATVTLQEAVDAAMAMGSPEQPVAIELNHPNWDGTPKAPELARQLERLPLVEVWNGPEPLGIQVWWELLNRGLRTRAITNTDTHGRRSVPVGARRTYVYLGDQPLTEANVIRALLAGRSFLSRGAILELSVNGRGPGEDLVATELAVEVKAQSVRPVERVELVRNGEVIERHDAGGATEVSCDWRPAAADGWYLVQVMEAGNAVPLAQSNPVFVTRG